MIDASRAAVSAASRRSVTSRTAAVTSVTSRTAAVTTIPSPVSTADSEISAGKVLPSRRRAASSIPAPIGRGRGSVTYSARCRGCTARAWSGTSISTGCPISSSRP